MDSAIATTEKLKNGMEIFSHKMNGVRSVSLSIAVKAGSSNEPAGRSGAAHFTEHMVFKGTKTRSPMELKEPIERVGGTLNAFTGKENTVYFARVPDSKSRIALSILKDICSESLFPQKFFDLEKQVVMEEISAADDDPADIVYEQFFKNVWGKCNYGNPVLGTLDSIKNINRQDLLDFYKTKYNPSNMVFSIAGNFTQDLLESFSDLSYTQSKREMSSLIYAPERFVTVTEREDLKQFHMLIGIEAPSRQDPDFNVFQVLNTLLGGGMSSKLFNRLREELGLVYTIDSGLISYPEGGLFFIYAATTPERFIKLKDELMKELLRLMKKGINEQDINYGKERLKGKLLLSTESTYSTMMRNLDTGLAFGRPLSVEEMVERVNAVDISRMEKVMEHYFSRNWVLSLVTPKKVLKQSLIDEWEENGITI